jgi:hypothetical protein
MNSAELSATTSGLVLTSTIIGALVIAALGLAVWFAFV